MSLRHSGGVARPAHSTMYPRWEDGAPVALIPLEAPSEPFPGPVMGPDFPKGPRQPPSATLQPEQLGYTVPLAFPPRLRFREQTLGLCAPSGVSSRILGCTQHAPSLGASLPSTCTSVCPALVVWQSTTHMTHTCGGWGVSAEPPSPADRTWCVTARTRPCGGKWPACGRSMPSSRKLSTRCVAGPGGCLRVPSSAGLTVPFPRSSSSSSSPWCSRTGSWE